MRSLNAILISISIICFGCGGGANKEQATTTINSNITNNGLYKMQGYGVFLRDDNSTIVVDAGIEVNLTQNPAPTTLKNISGVYTPVKDTCNLNAHITSDNLVHFDEATIDFVKTAKSFTFRLPPCNVKEEIFAPYYNGNEYGAVILLKDSGKITITPTVQPGNEYRTICVAQNSKMYIMGFDDNKNPFFLKGNGDFTQGRSVSCSDVNNGPNYFLGQVTKHAASSGTTVTGLLHTNGRNYNLVCVFVY